MRKKIILIGALTSKPYAFQSRSWELKQLETIDLYDSLGSNIKINYRGSEILRILPSINENINEEWISDKARFAYDALNKWRYTTPFFKENNQFKKVSWLKSFELIKENIKKKKLTNVNAFLGANVDLKTQVLLKKILLKKNSSNLFASLSTNHSKVDFLSNSTIKLDTSSTIQNKLYLFLGINLRLENPILNIKFRNFSKKKNYLFLTIGPNYNNNCYMFHLGTNLKTLVKILEGKHWGSIIFNKYTQIPTILGSKITSRLDYLNIFNLITKTNKLIIRILPLFSGSLNSNYINFNTNSKQIEQKNTLYWFLNTSKVLPLKKYNDKFVIYQGHHYDGTLINIDLILPVKTFYENNQKYLNCLNILQETKAIPFVDKLIKDDWQVVKLLGKYVLDINLPTKDYVRDSYLKKKKLNHLDKITYTYKKPLSYLFTKNTVNNTVIKKLNSNYYVTDSLTKASITMKKCTKAFFNNKYTYIWK